MIKLAKGEAGNSQPCPIAEDAFRLTDYYPTFMNPRTDEDDPKRSSPGAVRSAQRKHLIKTIHALVHPNRI